MKTKISKIMIFSMIFLPIITSSCKSKDDSVLKKPDTTEYRKNLEARLSSKDWQTRYDALLAVKALGWDGRDLMLMALKDKSEIISKAAQAWFVDQGEPAIDFLTRTLQNIDHDIGMYACVAGGKERNRGKSVAGTLWLTLVRGLPRDRCYELMQTLAHHPSARIRSVVILTAASLRNEKYLEFFDILATDTDPLVRRMYLESLVRLNVLAWYSTPDLDEPTTAGCLRLLEPELIAILNSDQPARFHPDAIGATLGELIGESVLRYHRDRFIAMLEEAIPLASEQGAARAGAAIERQCWILKDMDKWINSHPLLPRERIRDDVGLQAVYNRLVEGSLSDQSDKKKKKYIYALSSFPYALYTNELIESFFGLSHDSPASSRMAAKIYEKAVVDKDESLQERALGILQKNITHSDEKMVFGAVSTLLELSASANLETNSRLKEILKSQVDRLFELRNTVSLKELSELVSVFALVDDERCFQLFEQVWDHRYSENLDDAGPVIQACHVLIRQQDERIIPLMLDYVSKAAEVINTGLDVSCIYALLGNSYGEEPKDFLTDEIYEQFLTNIQDPDQHPRARAAYSEMLHYPHLTSEQKETLVNVFLKLARPPNDSNIRSKICWNMGKIKERRIIPIIYEMLMEDDTPLWVCANGLYGLGLLDAEKTDRTGSTPKGREGARKAIDFLETTLLLYPEPKKEIELCHVNNYYSWGIMYVTYPPLLVLQMLRELTDQDFGYDMDAWKNWLASEK